MAVTLTDEGIVYSRVDHEHILNLTDPTFNRVDARRRELHVNGKTYSHVSETAGQWLYRCDK